MTEQPSDKPDYVLVYDGEAGLRMAPASARRQAHPEPGAIVAGQPSPAPTVEASAQDWTGRRRLTLLGFGGLCAIGLGLGFAGHLMPSLPQVGAAPPPSQMHVVVAPETRPGPPQVKAGEEKLEVLPRAALALGPMPLSAPAPVRAVPQAPVRIDLPEVALAPIHPREDAPDQAALNCRGARSPADFMVCHDPGLQAADRRLKRAFRAAARAGMPYDQLRAEQDDWLDIREDAAERSPRAVAQVYDQRIEELETMASDGPQTR